MRRLGCSFLTPIPEWTKLFVFLGGNLAVVKAGDGTVERFEDWEFWISTLFLSHFRVFMELSTAMYMARQAPRR